MNNVEIILCFAWQAEAKPFIELLGAKRKHQIKNFTYYSAQNTHVCIAGLGQLNMAAAMGWIQQFTNNYPVFWNVGFCGAKQKELYSWHHINKVSDANGGRDFYPEIQIEGPLPFADIITVNQPQTTSQLLQQNTALVDMEAYGFCKALQQFVSTSQIQLLKWVSDSGSDTFNRNTALENYNHSAPKALHFIQDYSRLIASTKEKNEMDLSGLKKQVEQYLQLTFTQEQQLNDALKFALFYRNQHNIITEINNTLVEVNNKEEKNKLFNNLLQKLTHV